MTLGALDALLAEAEYIADRLPGGGALALGRELRDLGRRIGERLPRVVLASAFTAGKTTLLRGWFGLQQLPVGRTATTAVPTRVAYGDPDLVVLNYRAAVEVALVRSVAGVDRDVADALTAWAQDPAAFGIRAFEVADGSSLESGEVLAMVARAKAGSGEYPAAVVVRFTPRSPEVYWLTDLPGGWLASRLTQPELSLALAEVHCHVHHPRLCDVTVIDTPGYGAAAGYHEQVTDEVLRLRPEIIIVLIDGRRLDEPRTRRLFADVWGGPRGPVNGDATIVGLTYWQSLLTDEARDRGLGRAAADDRAFHEVVLAEKRQELATLLSAYTRVLPSQIVPIELGPREPAWLAGHPPALLELATARALDRSRPPLDDLAAGLVEQTRRLTEEAAEQAVRVRDERRRAAEVRHDRLRALDTAVEALESALRHGEARLVASVERESASLQAAVGNAQYRKAIRQFITEDYGPAWDEVTGRLRTAAEAHREALSAHLGDDLPALPALWNPAAPERERRIRDVTNIVDSGGYWAGRLADGLIPTRFSAEPHERARDLIRVYVRGDINAVRRAVRQWLAQLTARAEARAGQLEAQRPTLCDAAKQADEAAATAERRVGELAALSARADRLAAHTRREPPRLSP